MPDKPIPGLDNVYYDAASAYPWEALNETEFLASFFKALAVQMGDQFKSWRFFVVSSHDPQVIPESVAEAAGGKVLVFISDESCTMPDRLYACYDLVFKSYLPHPPQSNSIRSFPLVYVCGVPHLPIRSAEQRQIGIFFSGNLNTNRFPLYRQLHPLLRRLPDPHARLVHRGTHRIGWPQLRTEFSDPSKGRDIAFSSAFKGGLPLEEYGRRLADAKIVLCPRGFTSPETFRHMEALRAGAVVISEPQPETRWYRGSPIKVVADWQEGLRLADELLHDRAMLGSLQRLSADWWRNVCSETAVAQYVAFELAALRSGR
jgi:hypothetical protein